MTKRYKDTIFLPQTSFAMKGNLSEREPVLLAQWQEKNLYHRVRQHSLGRPPFTLHFGPPYANGHLHMGHALSGLLKDITARFHQMLGYDAPLVPGWDCHGLPIEWKVEEEYRAQGCPKETVPIHEFRAQCRAFAERWIQVQSQEFQRLGILADWDQPYLTYSFSSQAAILENLGHFLRDGSLYRGVKPVMWSAVEKTALAEAEIEYRDRTSVALDVAFPIHHTPCEALRGAYVVIWTTTPWSLPGNRAIAYGPDISYLLVQGSDARRYVISDTLKEECAQRWGLSLTVLKTLQTEDLHGTLCRHPWYGQGYDFDVPLLPGPHVTEEEGTGFVHTAPEHGVEDFLVGQTWGIPTPQTVNENGCYHAHVPLWSGMSVFKAHTAILESLQKAGFLLSRTEIVHSYPHSWRSKAPLIYRTTPQWFISLERTGLRQKALKALDDVKWTPAQGYKRLRGMIEHRPDWCVSRQRVWGVPLAFFVHKQTGEPLRDPRIHQQIIERVRDQGSDFWFQENQGFFKALLSPEYSLEDYEPVQDILDVWFDSGTSHQYVCQARPELSYPADVYLEGSDQHRGWFQSSLLTSVAVGGVAPYRCLVTHGFLLDQTGHKLSKSQGNGTSLDEILKKYGADVLRLWVMGSDYTNDLALSPDILKYQEDIYRRLRNTFRYLLGVLSPSTHIKSYEVHELPLLERWVLHQIFTLQETLTEKIKAFEYSAIIQTLHHFCAQDLSAFYFDMRKDALYCGDLLGHVRGASLFVMDRLFESLVRWLAPILSFTSEEAWQTRHGPESSVHEHIFLPLPLTWHQPVLAQQMVEGRTVRRVVTGALEAARVAGKIGSSLEAHVDIYGVSKQTFLIDETEGADFFIVSSWACHQDASDTGYRLPDVPGISVAVSRAGGAKCERCWKWSTAVQDPVMLCVRCQSVVHHG